MELSENKPTEKDKKKAQERLLKIIKKRCFLCQENDEKKIFEFKILNGPTHFMCINCHEKELKNEDNNQIKEKNKTDIDNDCGLSDYTSNDTAIKNNRVTKKYFCKICFEEHISIEEHESVLPNDLGKVSKFGDGKFKCCKGKCSIF